MTIIALVVWLLILGFVAWVVDQSPITNPTFKTFIRFVLIVIAAVLVISFLLNITGVVTPKLLI